MLHAAAATRVSSKTKSILPYYLSAALPFLFFLSFFVCGRDYAPGQRAMQQQGGGKKWRKSRLVLRERGKEHSGFLIAQTTGVSLIPCLALGVAEMKRWVSPPPFSGSSSLQAFYPLSRFLFISE